jgi:hypothetical protein
MGDDANHIDAAIKALLKLRDACTIEGIQIVDVQGVGPASYEFPDARRGVSLLVRVDVPVDVKHPSSEDCKVTP